MFLTFGKTTIQIIRWWSDEVSYQLINTKTGNRIGKMATVNKKKLKYQLDKHATGERVRKEEKGKLVWK